LHDPLIHILVRVIVALAFILSIGSCIDRNQTQLPVRTESATMPEPAPVNEASSSIQSGLIFANDNIQIFGDTTISKAKIHSLSIKFEPYISFDDFPVDSVEAGRKSLDFSTNKEAYQFRTRIRDAYNTKSANFAGYYTFVSWGCGSPCQDAVIVDRRTGYIYDAPPASLGYDFRLNSRMLIVNAPDSLGFYVDCVYCKPLIYILDEDSKRFIERQPR